MKDTTDNLTKDIFDYFSQNFKTDLFNRMNYEELKRCLLSKL